MKDQIENIIVQLSIMLLFAIIQSLPLFFLWNWLIVDIFNVKILNYLQFLGLAYLFNIMFNITYEQ